MFALFEDDFPHSWGPQASLPSAAQPAVMDIRPLRGRLLEIPYHKCESSEIKKIVSIVSIVFKNNASEKLKKTLSLKTTQAVGLSLFTWFVFPFHMFCLFLFTRKSSQKCFIVIVPRPRYMCTPTEVHVYPDRSTCVPRPRYMRISVGGR